jgi:hypothetical protein
MSRSANPAMKHQISRMIHELRRTHTEGLEDETQPPAGVRHRWFGMIGSRALP